MYIYIWNVSIYVRNFLKWTEHYIIFTTNMCCAHGSKMNWIRPRLSFMMPLVTFFHVDSFQKVLIKPARQLLRVHQHLHASWTHAVHTNSRLHWHWHKEVTFVTRFLTHAFWSWSGVEVASLPGTGQSTAISRHLIIFLRRAVSF